MVMVTFGLLVDVPANMCVCNLLQTAGTLDDVIQALNHYLDKEIHGSMVTLRKRDSDVFRHLATPKKKPSKAKATEEVVVDLVSDDDDEKKKD